MKRFLTVCLNPTLQVTVRLAALVPGQVNRARDSRIDASGKGINVTRILHHLGEEVVHLTHTGGRYAAEFADLIAADRLSLHAVPGDIEIRHCYTLIAENTESTTEIVEPGGHATAQIESAVLERFTDLVTSAHSVVISGSKAPGYSETLYPEMVRIAKRQSCRVILDFRGADLRNALSAAPDVIKINVSEFAQTFLDASIPEELPPEQLPTDLQASMLDLADRGTSVILTNGSQPVMFVEDRAVELISPVRVRPVNTIGAGDATTAGIASGLYRGLPLRKAIELGLDCARRNVELIRPGVIR